MPMEPSRACVGAIESVDGLTPDDHRQLWSLFTSHYDGAELTQFHRDLSEKQWVITLRRPDSTIVGFSTQVLLPVVGHPESLVLYSGDTVVAAPYRSSTALAGSWGILSLQLIDAYPGQTLYWFLISKGYKTYRYLPVFFREYYPMEVGFMPPRAAAIIDAVARATFGDRYDSGRRIIVAPENGCRLRPDVAPVDQTRLNDRHIQYFVKANPGHARGDELCCLAPLRRDNFTSAAWRVIDAATTAVLP
jgi:hypothetical protein